MIKLVCKNCGSIWYTANTVELHTCDCCDEDVYEENSNENNDKTNV